MRNLPCFTFSIFSMNSYAVTGYRFSSFNTTSCEAFSIRIMSIYFLLELFSFFAFTLPIKSHRLFQRGAKLRSFFYSPKVFRTFFILFFLAVFRKLSVFIDLSVYYSRLSPLLFSQQFQWTRFCFSGCKGNRHFKFSKTFFKFFLIFFSHFWKPDHYMIPSLPLLLKNEKLYCSV